MKLRSSEGNDLDITNILGSLSDGKLQQVELGAISHDVRLGDAAWQAAIKLQLDHASLPASTVKLCCLLSPPVVMRQPRGRAFRVVSGRRQLEGLRAVFPPSESIPVIAVSQLSAEELQACWALDQLMMPLLASLHSGAVPLIVHHILNHSDVQRLILYMTGRRNIKDFSGLLGIDRSTVYRAGRKARIEGST